MFLAWRTQLREAQQASELGRLDEAAQRLAAHKLRQYKPGEDFARQLAGAYLARAARRAEERNFAGAWHDLEQAKQLNGPSEPWHEAKNRLALVALRSLDPILASGDIPRATERLKALANQPLSPDQVREAEAAIRRYESAKNLAARGKFAEAEEQLAAAMVLRPEWDSLAAKLDAVRTQAAEVRRGSEALHGAMLAADWNQALAVADQLLAVAPELRVAREARMKAWAQVGAKMSDARPHQETQAWPSGTTAVSAPQTAVGTRFMLWVDAVGGFLVCLADEIWIGQAGPGNLVAVPMSAELSRKHAKITRSGDGYVLEAPHPVNIDGRPVQGRRVLMDGDELELGRGVRFRFRQPHALSASAKLEILSRHRPQPYADAILLMAESLVLGPKWQDHVVCKDWANDVVLFLQGNDLFCKTSEPVQIDGVSVEGRGALQPNSRVAGEEFSFSLELLG